MKLPPVAVRPVIRRGGFTLVELLTVVVIMGIVIVLLALSLGRSQTNNVQAAAGQVASGFNLARQIAVGKNTEARVVIATATNAPGLPEEPFRYWAIVSSNKTVPNLWVMEKDWEPLPTGVVFLNLATRDYNTIRWDVIPTNVIGTPLPRPTYGHTGADKEYLGFSSFGGGRLSYPDAPNNATHNLPSQTPFVGFKPSGAATFSASGGVGHQRLAGLRLAQGTVDSSGSIVLQTERNATVVETDTAIGKVVVRPRESYRE